MLEFIVGNESHTSYWGKFYVKGLEKWEVREEHESNRRDRHHSYQFLMANAPAKTLFTIFESDGNKRGTDNWIYKICVVLPESEPITEHKAAYGAGFCSGNYAVIAEANGKIKAPRLMDWWNARPADADPLAYAQHCAEWIGKRGVKDLPAMAAMPAMPA